MNTNRVPRLLTAIAVIFGLFALGSSALAAAKRSHHDGKGMLAGNLKTDGHHVMEKRGNYTTSVESKGGKISGVRVRHTTKGDIRVTKYKTHKKMALQLGGHVVNASFHGAQDQDMGTVYIGFGYLDDDGNEEIYWFPYDMIIDGDTGAVEYIAE